MTTKELGNLGEKLACEYLVGKGLNILGKNWRISFGEIDIIAQKKWRFWPLFLRPIRPIHFVEVKTIINSDGPAPSEAEEFFPEQRVDYKKQQKLRQLAQIWLQKNKFPETQSYQIDIIGITVNEIARSAKLHYFENAISEN